MVKRSSPRCVRVRQVSLLSATSLTSAHQSCSRLCSLRQMLMSREAKCGSIISKHALSISGGVSQVRRESMRSPNKIEL